MTRSRCPERPPRWTVVPPLPVVRCIAAAIRLIARSLREHRLTVELDLASGATVQLSAGVRCTAIFHCDRRVRDKLCSKDTWTLHRLRPPTRRARPRRPRRRATRSERAPAEVALLLLLRPPPHPPRLRAGKRQQAAERSRRCRGSPCSLLYLWRRVIAASCGARAPGPSG